MSTKEVGREGVLCTRLALRSKPEIGVILEGVFVGLPVFQGKPGLHVVHIYVENIVIERGVDQGVVAVPEVRFKIKQKVLQLSEVPLGRISSLIFGDLQMGETFNSWHRLIRYSPGMCCWVFLSKKVARTVLSFKSIELKMLML